MVFVAVFKLDRTHLIFVVPDVEMNSAYYLDMLLKKEMLSAIRSNAGELFIFQQDNAPAHHAR